MLLAVEYLVQADESGNVQFHIPPEFANIRLKVRVTAEIPPKRDPTGEHRRVRVTAPPSEPPKSE